MKTIKDIYYHFEDDVTNYPDAWCIDSIGGRSTGKTYSALKYCYQNNIKFVFMKRTQDDVDLLCAGTGRIGSKMAQYGADFSPFVPLNRDLGCNVKAFSIRKGIGAFWPCDDDNEPIGEPIGYIFSLNGVSKIKGFNLDDVGLLIMDEYIPGITDRPSRKEGEALMQAYDTVSRDREERGEPPLKLVLLANATKVNCPINEELALTDDIADMNLKDVELRYIEERGILIHRLKNNEQAELRKNRAIYKAMAGTKWAEESLGNKFAHDDFSCIGTINLKGFQPICYLRERNKMYYIYYNPDKDMYFMTSTQFNHKNIDFYDMDREIHQQSFYYDYLLDLRQACMSDKMLFKTYHMYDLIMNYKNIFRI